MLSSTLARKCVCVCVCVIAAASDVAKPLPMTGVAAKLMRAMGWRDGQPLGALDDTQGCAHCVTLNPQPSTTRRHRRHHGACARATPRGRRWPGLRAGGHPPRDQAGARSTAGDAARAHPVGGRDTLDRRRATWRRRQRERLSMRCSCAAQPCNSLTYYSVAPNNLFFDQKSNLRMISL